MIRTNDPVLALEFCAAATRLGLGLEVTAEGGGIYALATRDIDEGAALWWLLSEREPRTISRLDLWEMIDHYAERAAGNHSFYPDAQPGVVRVGSMAYTAAEWREMGG